MSGPDDDNGDEPRVRDLLAQAASSAVDPDTAARLASWFDLPSYIQLEEAEVRAQQAEAVAAPESNPVAERRRKAIANVDPAVLAHATRHATRSEQLRRAPVSLRWEKRILLFDERQAAVIMEPDDYPEVPIPRELTRDIKTCTPQASLRDLHRPEVDYDLVQYESPWALEDSEKEPEPDNPLEPVRAALRSSHRVGAIDTAAIAGTAEWIRLRRLLEQPWQESKRERARQRERDLIAQLEAEAAGKAAAHGSVVREPEEAP